MSEWIETIRHLTRPGHRTLRAISPQSRAELRGAPARGSRNFPRSLLLFAFFHIQYHLTLCYPLPPSAMMTSQSGDTERPQRPETNKRTGDDLQPETGAKRRAARACLSCRNRKVRCDVLSGGAPCTNCRLDSVSCVSTDSIRGRARTLVDTVNQSQRTSEPPSDFPVSLTFEGKLSRCHSAPREILQTEFSAALT